MSNFTKAYADEQANQASHPHTKGLLLDVFIKQIPNKFRWVSHVVVADDNYNVINAVKQYRQKNTSPIPITLIEVPKRNWNDENLYTTALKNFPDNWSFKLKFFIALTTISVEIFAITLVGLGVAAVFVNFSLISLLASMITLPIMAITASITAIGIITAILPIAAFVGYQTLRFFNDKSFKPAKIPVSNALNTDVPENAIYKS
jgi:hypothetical protein